MQLMPHEPLVGDPERAWLTCSEPLFVKDTSGTDVKLHEGWREVPGGFAGRLDAIGDTRIVFIPMTSVVRAWQYTGAKVCHAKAPSYDYDAEPF